MRQILCALSIWFYLYPVISSNLDSISMVTAVNTLKVANWTVCETHKINKMSITAAREIPKKKAARVVKRQRDYDYLYGKCILQTRKRRHLKNQLFDVSLMLWGRSSFHGFLRGGPLPVQSQGPGIQRPSCESLFFKTNLLLT